MELPRRSVLLLGVGVLVTGCASDDRSEPGAARTPTASPSSTPTPLASPSGAPTATPAALPDVRRWEPSPNDRVPACKAAAVRRVERAGTRSDRVVQVIDAQYGGLLADSASVLVVTRSWRRDGDRVRRGGATFDVRLSRRGRTWRVDAVHPSRPGAAVGQLSRAQRRVLASDHIDLPPAAERDVRSGRVHPTVLAAMLEVSGAHRIGVSVVRSGHPLLVFGTDRPSDHPQGRAFDTWRVDGRAVVDARTPRTLVTDYMQALARAGSDNVGGPYLLGAAPQWFSDDTHHDHVHAGFAT